MPKPPQPNPERLRTTAQVLEERPWISARWLRNQVEKKKLPHYKVNGRLLFDLDELDRYALENRVEAVGRRVHPAPRKDT